MCECLSRTTPEAHGEEKQRGRNTTFTEKNPGIDREVEEFSVLQCHTPISPRDCPQESLLSHQKAFCHCCKSLWGRGGLGAAQSQHPEKLPLPRNSANKSPLQNTVLLEPKLEGFHAPSRKGNVENSNRVKENAKRN